MHALRSVILTHATHMHTCTHAHTHSQYPQVMYVKHSLVATQAHEFGEGASGKRRYTWHTDEMTAANN